MHSERQRKGDAGGKAEEEKAQRGKDVRKTEPAERLSFNSRTAGEERKAAAQWSSQ